MGLSVIVPLVLLSQKKIRASANGLYVIAVLVVLGFITNRLNVSITGLEASAGVRYFPKWTELAITAAIIAAGFALFGLATKYLPIFPAEEHGSLAEPEAVEHAGVLSHAGD
jgi:Ni/Fe-hydrogenase subunit HybB-like protein